MEERIPLDVRRPIPGVALSGDVLVFNLSGPEVKIHLCRRLTVEEMALVRDYWKGSLWTRDGWRASRSTGWTGKVWRRLKEACRHIEARLAVESLEEEVTQPIEAETDLSALFELLASVGGKLPVEEKETE